MALARALILEPRLLLCDEPTGNLDGESADIVSSMLLDLHTRQNAILIIVTHNTALAQRCAVRYQLTNQRLIPASYEDSAL